MNNSPMDLFFLGDVIELNFPGHYVPDDFISTTKWVKYNPHKPDILRYGASLTSLDGGDSGVPDLTSLKEYNSQHNTKHREIDFVTPTKLADSSPNITQFLNTFDCARTHYLHIPKGGFFPYHRDSYRFFKLGDADVFRILCPVIYDSNTAPFILDGKVVTFKRHTWYVVNTSKLHCLFSFEDTVWIVANVLLNEKNLKALTNYIIG